MCGSVHNQSTSNAYEKAQINRRRGRPEESPVFFSVPRTPASSCWTRRHLLVAREQKDKNDVMSNPYKTGYDKYVETTGFSFVKVQGEFGRPKY